MKNCLILGFGRSGTSLMGGLLHQAGYFLGNHLHPARATNPKGFFEDMVINRINEQILQRFDYSKLNPDYPRYPKTYSPYSPRDGHRWLSMIRPGTLIECHDATVLNKMRKVIGAKQPFAYKDPRFNYTLPVWRPLMPAGTRWICMFRNPSAVIKSVLHECRSVPYLQDFYIDEELGFQIWFNSYRHWLDSRTPELRQNSIFVSYEDLIRRKGLMEIADFLDVPIKDDWIEPSLNRTEPDLVSPPYIRRLYEELRDLSISRDP